jgi:vancomycin resistance protein YoaR
MSYRNGYPSTARPSETARSGAIRPPHPLSQALLALAGGLALFIILVLGLLIGYDLAYAGRIYPGVMMVGADLSGLTVEEASAQVAQRLTYPVTGKIVFQEGPTLWVASPSEVGLYLDPLSSARLAYQYGRQGNPVARLITQFRAWYFGEQLSPLLVYDERTALAYLSRIAGEVNKPTIEASLQINGMEVVVQPGQVGRSLDLEGALQPLETQLHSLSDGLIPLTVWETPPAILDASAQAAIAEKILSEPLTLTLPEAREGDPGPWTLDRETLAKLLTIDRVEGSGVAAYQVGLETGKLRKFLEGVAPEVARQPANARYIFDDETLQLQVIQNAVIGRALNIDASIQTINEKAALGEHSIPLVVDTHKPELADDAQAAQLGITGLVVEHTTYFYGSSGARIQNIATAASRFHGVMVPPGATFSMAEIMGDVSLDEGYAEALIIFGNRTIKGVGGGVCQVSTTLFRTAFFGGYPIVERHPHAYRVVYYEYDRGGNLDTSWAGLDATVFVPVVDFKFTNDTPYWLLMETYVNSEARSITWKFYSTSDGRSVDWDSTGLRNTVTPDEPVYQENPELGKGEIRQVDWEVDGADVTVNRTVYKDGQVYLEDSFSTHYLPWRAVYEYGPGTKIKNTENLEDEE